MSDDLNDSPWRTAREAAQYLRLSEKTLRNRRAAGLGPRAKKSGGRIVYHMDELRRFIEKSDQINHRH